MNDVAIWNQIDEVMKSSRPFWAVYAHNAIIARNLHFRKPFRQFSFFCKDIFVYYILWISDK